MVRGPMIAEVTAGWWMTPEPLTAAILRGPLGFHDRRPRRRCVQTAVFHQVAPSGLRGYADPRGVYGGTRPMSSDAACPTNLRIWSCDVRRMGVGQKYVGPRGE